MSQHKEFELTDEEFEEIQKLIKDYFETPSLIIGGIDTAIVAENAIKSFWFKIGESRNCDIYTYQPSPKGNKYFLACEFPAEK